MTLVLTRDNIYLSDVTPTIYMKTDFMDRLIDDESLRERVLDNFSTKILCIGFMKNCVTKEFDIEEFEVYNKNPRIIQKLKPKRRYGLYARL